MVLAIQILALLSYNSAKNNTNKQESNDNQRLTKRNDAPTLPK